jgi:hypothetical protein
LPFDSIERLNQSENGTNLNTQTPWGDTTKQYGPPAAGRSCIFVIRAGKYSAKYFHRKKARRKGGALAVLLARIPAEELMYIKYL